MDKTTRSDIVILSNMYPKAHSPQYGIFVKNCVVGLEQAGFSVHLGVIAGIGRNLPEKIWKYIKYVFEGTWQVLRNPQAKVYVHYVAQSAIPYLIASLFCKRKLIAHIHGGDILREFESGFYYKVKNWLAKKLLEKADLIIVPSKYYQEVACAVFPLDPKRIFVSPSGGVNLKVFNPELKSQHSYKNKAILHLGSVGRLDPGKGLQTLILACSELHKQSVPFHLRIVGEGELSEELKALTVKEQIEDMVSFSGNVPQAQLKQVYSELDYFLFPTERETESLGLVGLEALACGTPVIAAAIAGPKGYIEHGENGFLFASGDVEQLVKTLLTANEFTEARYQEIAEKALNSSRDFDSERVNQLLTEKIAQL